MLQSRFELLVTDENIIFHVLKIYFFSLRQYELQDVNLENGFRNII